MRFGVDQHHFDIAVLRGDGRRDVVEQCGPVLRHDLNERRCIGSLIVDRNMRLDVRLAARGRTVYQTVCISCHNADPKKPGTLGPDVWGAPLELLNARIMSAGYPPGYKPKRATHVMQAFPQMKEDIPAIYTYLKNP